jgi:hypothetical protein
MKAIRRGDEIRVIFIDCSPEIFRLFLGRLEVFENIELAGCDGHVRPPLPSAVPCGYPFLPKAIHFLPYIQNILLAPRQGIDLESMSTSFAYGALILLFPVTSYWSQKASPENRILMLSMVFSVSVILLLSGKPGRGAIYMMPFVPMAIYCGLRFQYSYRPGSIEGTAKVPNWLFACVLICASPIWLYSWYEMSVQLLEGKREFAKRTELREDRGLVGRDRIEIAHRVELSMPATVVIDEIVHLLEQFAAPVWLDTEDFAPRLFPFGRGDRVRGQPSGH